MERLAPNVRTAEIRATLDHPVIDSDGHLTEFVPVALEYIAKAGGERILAGMQAQERLTFLSRDWYGLSDAERRERWTKRTPFWGRPLRNHGLDLATSMFPDLMYRRLDELGLDFTVLYPGLGIITQIYEDEETRRACCRGLNDFYADCWAAHPDRMTPVATIPMHTPQEAIEELEHAVGKRRLKAVMLPSWVKRPIKAVLKKHPEMARYAYWLDSYGIDSEYDYDAVWKKCAELGVVPSFHGPGEAFPFRNSISNAVYNHVGHFAAAADMVCKSLFLGGVTRRFPQLRFLFLEGGVGWARSLLADLTSHWEKRSLVGLASDTDPRRLDLDLFMGLYREYGGKLYRDLPGSEITKDWRSRPGDPTDAFAGLGIETKDDLFDLFVPSFYFGCEGDDPVMASAFDEKRNPGRVRLNAVYGSDISHWDVPVMNEILEEAYEPVEREMITAADFRDFVFTHPARLWTSANPGFFDGTVVESAVSRLVAGGSG